MNIIVAELNGRVSQFKWFTFASLCMCLLFFVQHGLKSQALSKSDIDCCTGFSGSIVRYYDTQYNAVRYSFIHRDLINQYLKNTNSLNRCFNILKFYYADTIYNHKFISELHNQSDNKLDNWVHYDTTSTIKGLWDKVSTDTLIVETTDYFIEPYHFNLMKNGFLAFQTHDGFWIFKNKRNCFAMMKR